MKTIQKLFLVFALSLPVGAVANETTFVVSGASQGQDCLTMRTNARASALSEADLKCPSGHEERKTSYIPNNADDSCGHDGVQVNYTFVCKPGA